MDVGDLVPDFELPDQDGKPVTLSGLLVEGPVVLFFYPAAMTAGCTREACHFRDLAAEFRAAGVQRVGISQDSVDKQKRFSDRHSFDYPLLADTEGVVSRILGVERAGIGKRFGGPVKRWTFAIDTDRRIKAVIHSELNMDRHADQALRAFTG